MIDMVEEIRRFESELAVLAAGRNAGLVTAASAAVRPMLAIATPGPLGLSPANRFGFESMSKSLAAAIGRPVRNVRLVSVDGSRLESGSVSADRFTAQAAASLRQRLEGRIWRSLGHHLSHRHHDRLWDGFSCPMVGRRLSKLVRERPGNGLVDRILYAVQDVTGNSREEAMFCFLAAAIVGAEDVVAKMVPLVRLLRDGAVPLGEKAGEDGTWYVLTA